MVCGFYVETTGSNLQEINRRSRDLDITYSLYGISASKADSLNQARIIDLFSMQRSTSHASIIAALSPQLQLGGDRLNQEIA